MHSLSRKVARSYFIKDCEDDKEIMHLIAFKNLETIIVKTAARTEQNIYSLSVKRGRSSAFNNVMSNRT